MGITSYRGEELSCCVNKQRDGVSYPCGRFISALRQQREIEPSLFCTAASSAIPWGNGMARVRACRTRSRSQASTKAINSLCDHSRCGGVHIGLKYFLRRTDRLPLFAALVRNVSAASRWEGIGALAPVETICEAVRKSLGVTQA